MIFDETILFNSDEPHITEQLRKSVRDLAIQLEREEIEEQEPDSNIYMNQLMKECLDELSPDYEPDSGLSQNQRAIEEGQKNQEPGLLTSEPTSDRTLIDTHSGPAGQEPPQLSGAVKQDSILTSQASDISAVTVQPSEISEGSV